jgi:hypothetical protein
MNHPRNGRDYAGWVAVILTVTLALVLLISLLAALAGREISEAGTRLITTIGVGLVGALAAYIGTAGRSRRGGDDP